ncbi:SCO0607 family lipoprotein [Streptomyces sp. NPDC001709]
MPFTWRTARPARSQRPHRVVAAVAVSVSAALGLGACSGLEYREDVCSSGEYPVMAVGSTGSACVAEGKKPPKGFVRYPQGKVPKQVDDKWDRYWNTHTLDTEGNIIDAP